MLRCFFGGQSTGFALDFLLIVPFDRQYLLHLETGKRGLPLAYAGLGWVDANSAPAKRVKKSLSAQISHVAEHANCKS